MTAFGFPVGPITLLDEVGIDVGAQGRQGHARTPSASAWRRPPSMAKVLADGRLGRKNKRGFYTYDGRKKEVDATVYALLPGGARARRASTPREIQERLVFAFLNEAVLCLQEGILRSPRDGDVGAIFGLGFPPFLGGPFRYLDHLGARFAVETLERLQRAPRRALPPAPMLVDMAREGRSFHAERTSDRCGVPTSPRARVARSMSRNGHILAAARGCASAARRESRASGASSASAARRRTSRS